MKTHILAYLDGITKANTNYSDATQQTLSMVAKSTTPYGN